MLITTTTDKQEQNRLDAVRKYQQAERIARWSVQLRIVKSLEELKNNTWDKERIDNIIRMVQGLK